MGLDGPYGGHQHSGVRLKVVEARLDVHEFLEPQVGPETRLCDHEIAVGKSEAVRDHGVAAVGDVPEGACVHQHRLALQRLHQVGLDGIPKKRHHRADGVHVTGSHGLPVAGESNDYLGQPLSEVVKAGGEGEDSHDLRRSDYVEAGLPERGVGAASKADHCGPQRPVFNVDHASPGDPARQEAVGAADPDGIVG